MKWINSYFSPQGKDRLNNTMKMIPFKSLKYKCSDWTLRETHLPEE